MGLVQRGRCRKKCCKKEKTMIRINQLKLPVTHRDEDIPARIAKTLNIPQSRIRSWNIVKQSVDARKKEQILFIYTVDVEIENQKQAEKKFKSPQIMAVKEPRYEFPCPGTLPLSHPPVIVGSGPAGLFCGFMLAQAGFQPVILERGQDVDTRREKVAGFWQGEALDLNSNVQFGEGGAGTFSDGKLNTLVKDPLNRSRKVLEILAEHGASPDILYINKPHIGTDVLGQVVKNIRNHIVSLGGTVMFDSQVTDLIIEDQTLKGVIINNGQPLFTEALVLAIGHSARDTFSMLLEKGVPMKQKAFAVGLRIQHPQSMINRSQYGPDIPYPQKNLWQILGPASYKVTWQTSLKRGVYSFCMCPGGYVVNASSEPGRLAVNGMSNHDRAGRNANSALIVTVTPEDFPGDSPLSGVEFQRNLEKLAYEYGRGSIPVQLYGDFKEGRESRSFGHVLPEFKGAFRFANLKEMLPGYLSDSIIEGVEQFEHMISGFSRYDAVLAGIESRTSSPVRILRDDRFESQVKGLFPCGEGAGYAGGITSAAMDGIKIAEELCRRYACHCSGE